MELVIEKSVVVITPSIATGKVYDCMDSVSKQTYGNLRHLVVLDGKDKKLDHFWYPTMEYVTLSQNTGSKGFYGHRIYAAFPHLVNQDYIAFLDEDNWYEPNHIETLVKTIESEPDLDFVYSLRNIYIDDKFSSKDSCESLGKWPIWFTVNTNKEQYLVDTSCYLFKREFIEKESYNFHFGWGGDRNFLNSIRYKAKYKTSGLYTMNYNLNSEKMIKNYGGMDFFKIGNNSYKEYYKGNLPWEIKK